MRSQSVTPETKGIIGRSVKFEQRSNFSNTTQFSNVLKVAFGSKKDTDSKLFAMDSKKA